MSPYWARLRPHLDPCRPLDRHDAHDVRQVLATFNRPFRDRNPFQLGKAILSALRRLAAHPAASRDLIKRQFAPPRAVNLVRDDARIGDLAGGEHAGHDGRHGPGRRERATAMDRFLPIGRALRARAVKAAEEAAHRPVRLRRRSCRASMEIPGLDGRQHFRITRPLANKPRVEQRGADLQGRAHRGTAFATRIAWTASTVDRSNMRLSVGTTGRGQV